MFKRMAQALFGVALAVQLTGCFYMGDDHRWHGGHREYHDPAVVVHVHD
jgi:hypothetical protein